MPAWRLTGFYDAPEDHNIQASWDLLWWEILTKLYTPLEREGVDYTMNKAWPGLGKL